MRKLAIAAAIVLGTILFSVTARDARALDLASCVSTCTVGATVYECDEVCNPGDSCVGKAKLICNGTCDGGPNDGLSCDSEDDCPDSAKTCVGGTNDGLTCIDNGDCPDEVSATKLCICDPGGNNPNCGNECTTGDDCEHFVRSCNGGTAEGEICVSDLDCPGASCKPDPDSTPPCKLDVDNGSCVGVAASCAPRASGASVLCAAGVSEITGSKQSEIICVGDGDVRVQARAGNDTVHKGLHVTIKDGAGNVKNPSKTGNLNVDLGPGDDGAFIGGNSHDLVFGGPGTDTVIACGGRNVIHGGDGDDLLTGTVFCTAADIEMGSIYCGDDGNDHLGGFGPSHQCMDGGNGDDYCQYAYVGDDPDGQEDEDFGTGRGCEQTDITLLDVPCGCESKLP